MSDGDLFREVEQAVRHERYRLIWERFGFYIIGVAALIVIVVAGYRGLLYWQDKQAQEAGAEFAAAVELGEAQKNAEAEKAFTKIAEDGPAGYQALARLRLAAADAQAGNTEDAISEYDALAEEVGEDKILRDIAIIQAATLRLPEADYSEMEDRVGSLIEEQSPWRYSAHDLLGLSAYRLKDMDTAEEQFGKLISDSGTPANLRQRATVMLAVIAGAQSGDGAEQSKAPDADASPAPETAAEPDAAAQTQAAPETEAAPETQAAPETDVAPDAEAAPEAPAAASEGDTAPEPEAADSQNAPAAEEPAAEDAPSTTEKN